MLSLSQNLLREARAAHFGLGILIFLFLFACVSSPPKAHRRPKKVEAPAGKFIPGYGFSIDARYDPRFDNLVPGYKLLTVVIRNTSLQVIQTDRKKDRWVVIDREGKKHRGIVNLKARDRDLWIDLPEKLKGLIDYPDDIPISYTATFDLLFPLTVPLKGFREVVFKNATWDQEFLVSKE